MTTPDDLRIRPGRIRHGNRGARRPKTFVGEVMRAAKKAGHVGKSFGRAGGGKRSSTFGRGRQAALALSMRSPSRRVVVMARIVRHHGARFTSAPLAKHVAYLKREGVTRDGQDASMFDTASDAADTKSFAGRCEDDRHHFRFTISPEDAAELADLRAFTRELMADVERDLGTRLEWLAVDHWNTDNPHVHVLIRGRGDDSEDLVISRDYISRGFRDRAAERVTLELGPRSEQEIRSALEKEVEAERWTSLDRSLRTIADESAGVADVEGVDGRTHHLRFSDLEMTGDATPGAIVEARAYEDANGRKRLSLATRSDLAIEEQVSASGATWLDRQLLAKESTLSSAGFGAEVREAIDRRVDHLVETGLAHRQGQGTVFTRDLLNTLRRRELDEVASKLSTETGLAHRPSAEGEHVSGVYRQRVNLASGRFAMIDDGLGFQLVPWRPALEQQLGRQVSGAMGRDGGVEWTFGRKRGLGL